MSISPQSLARTRDKRSLKVPARYDDFSEIPPEFTYRNVAEALKMKGRKSRPSCGYDTEVKIRPKETWSSSSKRTSLNSTTTEPATPTRKTTRGRPNNSAANANESGSSTSSNATSCTIVSNNAAKDSKDSHESTPKTSTTSDGIDLTCDETTPNEVDFKATDESELIIDETTPEDKSNKIDGKQSNIIKEKGQVAKAEQQKSTGDINELTTSLRQLHEAYKLSVTEKRQSTDDAGDGDQVDKIWRGSPFHPTISIRKQNVKFNETAIKPLVEQRPNSATTTAQQQQQQHQQSSHSSSRITTARKKSRGFSLMVKPNNPYGSINTTPINSQQQQQTNPHQHQAKYFNNLPTNMQYGTRLLLNEPVYLPRSVNPIAPITVSLQQIANQARKPPFISKRAEAFLKYQDARKLDLIASNHGALIRMIRYLGVRDRLNLKRVSSIWKGLINSEIVWKKVLLDANDSGLPWKDLCNFLKEGSHMTDIMFDHYVPKQKLTYEFGSQIILCSRRLKRVWIKSTNSEQNTFAFCLLKSFGIALEHCEKVEKYYSQINKGGRDDWFIELHWLVKVAVDDFGVATLEMEHDIKRDNGIFDGKVVVQELYDLEAHLNELYKNQDRYLKRRKPFIQLYIKPV